jgi:hypothetical protein
MTTYYALPTRGNDPMRKIIPNRFSIYQLTNGDTTHLFDLSNQGDRLNNLLKRGIPLEDAKKLFYEMDKV